jgi:hypothetical protein
MYIYIMTKGLSYIIYDKPLVDKLVPYVQYS